MNDRGATALAVLAAALVLAGPARAGPPYVTDDPEPTRTGGWENYAFVSGTSAPGETAGEAGVELNYGAARDLQLSLDIPLSFDRQSALRAGGGDLQFAAKYRFLHAQPNSWTPDVAVFPALTTPTGARDFHSGHASLFLPVWAEKDFGKWSVFGGGGYDINPGAQETNFGLAGLAVTRAVGKRLNLGIEVYHQTPDTVGGRGSSNIGLGAVYQLTHHWALMGSGGPGLERTAGARPYAFYASLQFTN